MSPSGRGRCSSPHPPVWVPVTGSKETVEWAAKHDVAITPGVFAGPMREDSIRYFARCMGQHGRSVTPKHISVMVDCYVADSKAQAVEEYGPYLMYLFNTLLPYGQVYQKDTKGYYSSTAFEHLRQGTKGTLAEDSTIFNAWTMETVRAAAEHMPIGTADEIVERIIAECNDAGAGSVLLICNRGASAAGDVPEPDPPHRPRGAAASAGSQHHRGAARPRTPRQPEPAAASPSPRALRQAVNSPR